MIRFAILITALVCAVPGIGQNDDKRRNLDVMLRLAEFVSWPQEEDGGDKTLNVMIAAKDAADYEKASQYLESQSVGDKSIKTALLNGDAEIPEDVHIIFVNKDAETDFEKLYAKISGRKIMTVSDGEENMGKGCMFYVSPAENGGFEYLFNSSTVVSSGMRIKSLLLTPKHDWELLQQTNKD